MQVAVLKLLFKSELMPTDQRRDKIQPEDDQPLTRNELVPHAKMAQASGMPSSYTVCTQQLTKAGVT